MMSAVDVDMVRVDRLREAVDPFWVLNIPEGFNWSGTEPTPEFKDDFGDDQHRSEAYHLGRVRYFTDQFKAEAEVDPVEIDCRWNRYSPEHLSLIDGHHRLCGAILAEASWIPASVGGPLEMINWLKGLSDTKPEWM